MIDSMARAFDYNAEEYYGNSAFRHLPLWQVHEDNIVQPDDFVVIKGVKWYPNYG